MTLPYSQNFDGATPPAAPSGWHFDSGITTITAAFGSDTIAPHSSPNFIGTTGITGNHIATYGATDGASGNAIASVFAGTGNTTGVGFGLIARSNSATPSYSSSTFYDFVLNGTSNICKVNKCVSGTLTNLFSLNITGGGGNPVAANLYYQLVWSLNGSTLSIEVIRQSDGYYLDMTSGAFTSAPSQQIITDSSITGQGYWGIVFDPGSGANHGYADNFALTQVATALAATEARDTFAGSGMGADPANLAPTEAHDTFAGIAHFKATGVGAAAEAHDTFAGAASFHAMAAGLAVEHHDTFAGFALFAHASLGPTEGRDSFAGLVGVHAPATGDGLERHDIFQAFGQVFPFMQGTEAHDVFAGSAAAAAAIGATMAPTEGPDIFGSGGGFTFDAIASRHVAEQHDTFAGTVILSAAAVLHAVEGHDLFAGAVSVPTVGVLDALERPDFFSAGYGGNVAYHVYANTGIDDPINYNTPIATTASTTYTTGPLAYPGIWWFGVRAFYVSSGLEEQNLDCSLEVILDSSGHDITNRPGPPNGLRGFATAGGGIRVEWAYPLTMGPKAPTGFHIYSSVGALSYATPAATVLYSSGFGGSFVGNLPGNTNGVTYTIGVRAFNATAEESNTASITVTADSVGPTAVIDLLATPTM